MNPHLKIGNWVIPVLVLSGGAAYLAAVYLPGQRTLARLGSDVQTKTRFVQHAGTLASAIEAVERELEETTQYNQAWRDAAPSAGNLSQLFERINRLATHSGTAITHFNPEPIELHDRVGRVPVEVGCTGTFAQGCRFLQEMERLPQVIWINRLRIQADSKDGESVTIDMDLEVFADNPESSGQVEDTE